MKYCKCTKSLVGKTALITGANSGIGYETALEFAKRGGRVILACRNSDLAEKAREQIVKATGNTNVVVKLVDLASLASVRNFAEDINGTEERLDILVNNAGALQLPNQLTEDGLQLQMQINYFSHFLLTNLLLDLLKRSAPSRVVNVSSKLAFYAKALNLDDLNGFHGDWALYNKSKLCNILFTVELAKRLEGSNVTTFAVHPGAINTNIQRNSKWTKSVAKYFFKTPVEGAQTTLYVSLEDGIENLNGSYFEECKLHKLGRKQKDPEMARKLWEVTTKMVHLE